MISPLKEKDQEEKDFCSDTSNETLCVFLTKRVKKRVKRDLVHSKHDLIRLQVVSVIFKFVLVFLIACVTTALITIFTTIRASNEMERQQKTTHLFGE
jgi:ammonia channel protein AmtB